jgi:hypothetical protein
VLPMTEGDGFEFSCIIVAKPPLKDASFGCETEGICGLIAAYPINAWHPADDTVYSGMLTNAYVDDLTSKTIYKGRMTMKVRMKRVDLIGRKFTFGATNDKATVYHQVKLIASGASHILSTVATSLVAPILLLLAINCNF